MTALSDSFDWVHAGIASLSSVVGGVVGLMAGAWRVGRIEPMVRLEVQRDLAGMENDIRDRVAVGEARNALRVAETAQLLNETLKALGQKVIDVEIEMVRGYVSKVYFDDFRREHREDMQRLMDKLDDLLRR